MKLYHGALIIGVITAIFVFNPVIAQNSQGAIVSAREQLQRRVGVEGLGQRTIVDSARSERILAQCSTVVQKLEGFSDSVRAQKEAYASAHAKLNGRLQAFITSAEATELDTKQLETDAILVNGYVNQVQADFALYEVFLAELTSTNCEDANAQIIVDLLQDIRSVHSLVESSNETLESFVRTSVKVDMLALKEAINQPTNEGDGES